MSAPSPSEHLYVFGGCHGSALSSLSRYDSTTEQWTFLPPMPLALSHFAYTAQDGKIYVAGGCKNNRRPNRQLFAFDIKTEVWTTLADMINTRETSGMVYLDGFLYNIGGGKSPDTRYCERYSIADNRWENICPLIQHRWSHHVVAFNGFIYAIAGCDNSRGDSNNVWTKTVERYDPSQNLWEMKNSLTFNDDDSGAVVFDNKIYVIGSKNCEVYCPEEDQWKLADIPGNCNENDVLTVFNGMFTVLGGFGGYSEAGIRGKSTAKYFDPETKCWNSMKDLDCPRYAFGAVVIKNSGEMQ